MTSSTRALFFNKERCFSQSQRALYENFIIDTNRFGVAVRVSSNRSQKMSQSIKKYGIYASTLQ